MRIAKSKPPVKSSVDWSKYLKPLFKQYGGRKHPLNHKNAYQLVVGVVLSARDSDRHINEITPSFFGQYPSMKELSRAKPEELFPLIGSVTNFGNKAKWLVSIAQTVKEDKNIPKTIEGLTALNGIGRKSANVIMSELGCEMEGVIVDLHVLRVAPRLGIAVGTNPEKIEKQLMETVPQKHWRELGMGLTFLGREICRPTNPKCPECVMNVVCEYYKGKQ
jgi:endonuclease-3